MNLNLSEGKLDNSTESRPLPVPPREGYNSNELYTNRYDFFKGEIEKWKHKQAPHSPKNKHKGKSEAVDQSLSWNLENENSMNRGNGLIQNNLVEKAEKLSTPSHRNENKGVVKLELGLSDKKSQGKKKTKIIEEIASNGESEDERPLSSKPSRQPLQELRTNSMEMSGNIFKDHHDEDYSPSHQHKMVSSEHTKEKDRETTHKKVTMSPVPEATSTTKDKKSKKLEIPANLNLNESQIEFLKDVQNVLILFSDLKSKVEKLNKDKTGLKEELKKAVGQNKKLKEDLATKTSQASHCQNQLNISMQESKALAKELAETKAKLKDLDQLENVRNELRSKEAENVQLKVKMKQLQIDQSVLQEIIKEMIFEKENKKVGSCSC